MNYMQQTLPKRDDTGEVSSGLFQIKNDLVGGGGWVGRRHFVFTPPPMELNFYRHLTPI